MGAIYCAAAAVIQVYLEQGKCVTARVFDDNFDNLIYIGAGIIIMYFIDPGVLALKAKGKDGR